MGSKKSRILLIMHTVPLDSAFLATKLISLAEEFDVHLLAWDDSRNIDKFMEAYRLPADFRRRIHLGINKRRYFFKVLYCLCVCVLRSAKVRRYIWGGGGSFLSRIKFIVSYLPALFINPGIIHFEFGTLAKAGMPLKQLTDAKLSVSFRGYDINYAGLSNATYYQQVWDNIDGVHFLGQDLKQRAIEKGYHKAAVEVIIPPAIDTTVFKSAVSADKFKGDKLLIVSVGRLVWKKGYEYAIQAAAALKAKNIPFEYSIIGEGIHKQALEFTIHELGLQDCVFLCGNQDRSQVKQALEKAHVFLHPSISEGFSNAVLEAQAMGVPVICSDADGLPENVVNNSTGFITPKWNVEKIAERLEWCWNNKEKLDSIGNAGIARVNKHFRLEQQVAAFKTFYNTLFNSTNAG